MKKIIVALLVLTLLAPLGSLFAAEDWSEYESGRNNIRLEGYSGQPGYIRFEDGNGTTTGYLWIDADRGPVWCTPQAASPGRNIDTGIDKLLDDYGVPVADSYSA